MVDKLDTMWDNIETQVSKSGSTSYFLPTQKFLFHFLTNCLVGADPSPEISDSGHIMLDKWLALQLLPTIAINILQPLEEIFLHSFSYPFWLVKNDYSKLVEFVKKEGQETLQRGQNEFNLTEQESIHNLLFILGFNAYGGFSLLLQSLLTRLGENKDFQSRLKTQVREKMGTDKTKLASYECVQEMDLLFSFVYETLRLAPPVPSQFARARKDFELSSHDSVFQIKKGELLCGYQPVVMMDSEVFDEPEKFVPDRFTKEKNGEELLNYLFWSNGPQTGRPDEHNKQCAGKDIVTLTAALFLAYIFLRFDSVSISSGSVKGFVKPNN